MKEKTKRRIRRLWVIILLLSIIVVALSYGSIISSVDKAYIKYYVGYEDKIYLIQEDVDWLEKNYEIYENEFAVCMEEGFEQGKQVYKATRTTLTNVSEESVSLYCKSEDEWIIHSHPEGYCSFSETDLETLENSTMKYMGIMCDKNYIKVIDRNEERVEIEVI